jgi:hypothetical protein
MVSLILAGGGLLHVLAHQAALAGSGGCAISPVGFAMTSLAGLVALMLVPLMLPVVTAGVFLLLLKGLRLGEPEWKSLFALTAHAELVLALMVVANGCLQFSESAFSGGIMVHPAHLPGLDLLLPQLPGDTILFTLSRGVNPFTIWYIYVLGSGAGARSGVRRVSGVGIAALAWVIQEVLGEALFLVLVECRGG